MKKTLNINLAGYPFIIDEDAYNLLKDYLDTIRYAFDTQDDTGEIAADIESRIAEILLENESGKVRIVSAGEISKVIQRIGKPSDFIETGETIIIDNSASQQEIKIEEEPLTPPPYNKPGSKNPDSFQGNPNFSFRKKLFRDPQNAMLGGVCSGLAYYTNIDVTIIRLLAVLLLFLSASTVAIVYIVMWIVVPEARTPLERMQMKGEDPTMENIGKSVTSSFQNDDLSQADSQPKGFLAKSMSIFVKCLIIFGLLIVAPVVIVLAAALIGCVIAVFVIGIGIFSGGMFDSTTEGLMVLYILFAVIGGAITLGIPLWLLIKMLWNKNRDHQPANPTTQRSILVIWLCGIALLAVFTVKAVKKSRQLDRQEWAFNIDNIKTLDEMEESDLDQIKIENGSLLITTKDGRKIEILRNRILTEEAVEEEEEEGAESTSTVQDTIVMAEETGSINSSL